MTPGKQENKKEKHVEFQELQGRSYRSAFILCK